MTDLIYLNENLFIYIYLLYFIPSNIPLTIACNWLHSPDIGDTINIYIFDIYIYCIFDT